MNVTHPHDLADLRLHLLERWNDGRTFAQLAEAGAVNVSSPSDGGIRRLPDYQAASWIRWERQHIAEATLWWVSSPMCDVLEAAARSVPAETMPGDLLQPSPSGLVVFERPIIGIDADPGRPGGACEIRAYVWGGAALPALHTRPELGRQVRTLTLSAYVAYDFGQGLDSHQLQQAMALRAFEQGTTTLGARHDLGGGSWAQPANVTGQAWCPLGRSDWPVVDQLARPVEDNMPLQTVDSMLEDRRLLAALWTMVATPSVATTETAHPPRQERRRSERANIRPDLIPVRVVYLRQAHRRTERGDTPVKVEWSCRWTVTGHWRRQPCGPGRRDRRLTWIPPHVKGPDDQPMKMPTRVNAWVR